MLKFAFLSFDICSSLQKTFLFIFTSVGRTHRNMYAGAHVACTPQGNRSAINDKAKVSFLCFCILLTEPYRFPLFFPSGFKCFLKPQVQCLMSVYIIYVFLFMLVYVYLYLYTYIYIYLTSSSSTRTIQMNMSFK